MPNLTHHTLPNGLTILLREITGRQLVAGYEDDGPDGVRGYGGKLDIGSPLPVWGNLEVRYNCGSIMMY